VSGDLRHEEPLWPLKGPIALQAATFPRQVSLGGGSARSVIAASPQAEVAGGHSVNADEQCDKPERPEDILGHRFPPEPALTKPCRWQCALSAAKCHARSRAPVGRKAPDLLAMLTADCPKRGSFSIHGWCRAVYERRGLMRLP
jgi:hypothetical protein